MPDLQLIIQWINKYPRAGWILLAIYFFTNILRHRVINAEPGSVFRWLFNFRNRRLEKMISQDHLNKKDIKLVKSELRQRSLYQLTGIFDNQLQKLVVKVCNQNNLRSRYFQPWIGFLKTHNGCIIFNHRSYKIFYFLSLIFMFFITAFLITLAVGFINHYGIEHLAIFLIVNILLWWGPIIVMMALPMLEEDQRNGSLHRQF